MPEPLGRDPVLSATSANQGEAVTLRIKIENFSCVAHADIELAPITVLIGPQASGKSVISKMIYFMSEIFSDQFRALEEGFTLTEFQSEVGESFKEWFPETAWGSSAFRVELSSGDFYIRILRRVYGRRTADSVRVVFSKNLRSFYRETAAIIEKYSQEKGSDAARFDHVYRAAREAEARFGGKLYPDYYRNQIFIPAGRAFFSSIGKAIAAWEQLGALDPVTARFGRLYAAVRGQGPRRFIRRSDRHVLDAELVASLLGGEIKSEKNKEFVLSRDGRKLPFSILSSGQQEVLPLISVMNYWLGRVPPVPNIGREMVYIEEPEAHLFPTSQSQLMKGLCAALDANRKSIDLFVTTHSPYVLATINNLMKAGGLVEKKPDLKKTVQEIISEKYWLKPSDVSAYALIEGRAIDIVDREEGLISPDYLDHISEDIAQDFSALMEIEMRVA